MLKDRMLIWILEYIVGGMLVVAPLPLRIVCLPVWTDAHTWAAQLFVIGLGVILISCASSMRQRLLLAGRIDTLTKQVAEGCRSSSQTLP